MTSILIWNVKQKKSLMNLCVPLQPAAVHKCCSANITSVRTVAAVNSLVHQQLTGTTESLATVVAQIWSLFRVRSYVNFMRVVCGESFRALGTLVRSVSRMETDVGLQVAALGERFAAMVANIWLLSGVQTLMRHGIAPLMEPLIAIPTLISLDIRVCLEMLAQPEAFFELGWALLEGTSEMETTVKYEQENQCSNVPTCMAFLRICGPPRETFGRPATRNAWNRIRTDSRSPARNYLEWNVWLIDLTSFLAN